jgi:hypothetical protein
MAASSQADHEGETISSKESTSGCSCVADPYASLPPEARPRPLPKKGALRQVTCPRCARNYWTNRRTDFCLECEQSTATGANRETDR